MVEDAPFARHQEPVKPEWLDYNGHMNLAYYLLAFDHASDVFFDHLGVGRNYIERTRGSIFVVETHVVYHREVTAGDMLRFSTVLLAHDAKRLHFMHHMHHAGEGYVAAANELMALHVSLETRRAKPFPCDVLATLARVQAAHDRLPRPAEMGRSVAFRQRAAAQ